MALPVSKNDMADLLELLTHKGKEGVGYYDVLMRANSSHIQAEFEAGRMSPSEYANMYVALAQATLQGAIQYLTQAPAALEQANLVKAQVAIANADLLLREKELEIREQELLQAQKQNELLDAQKAKLVAETANITQSTSNMVEQGKALVFETTSAEHKAKALEYRVDAEYATTHDLLPDGSTVGGSIGKDIALKEAQAVSMKARDMFQMVNAMQSSNTAQVTTLGDVSIAPNSTTGSNIDTAVTSYYNLLGVTVE